MAVRSVDVLAGSLTQPANGTTGRRPARLVPFPNSRIRTIHISGAAMYTRCTRAGETSVGALVPR